MDASRYRPHLDRRRPGRAGRPDAGRSAGRRGAFGALGRHDCGPGDRRQRARAGAVAGLPDRDGLPGPACGRELRARAGHRGDQPRPRRPCGPGRADRTQRPFHVHRCRAVRRRHGGIGPSPVESGGVPGDGRVGRADRAGAWPHPDERRRPVPRSSRDVRTIGAIGSGFAAPSHKSSAHHLCVLHPAVPSCQCGDASAHGRRHGDPCERVGNRVDRGVHDRAAARRRGVLALGRTSIGVVGTPAAAGGGVRGARGPRRAVRDGDGPVCGHRRAIARRHFRRRARRDVSAGRRRRHAHLGTVQPRPGDRRQRGRVGEPPQRRGKGAARACAGFGWCLADLQGPRLSLAAVAARPPYGEIRVRTGL